eukprot:NODE_1077_length_2323_cov_0.329137.p1 type:complete len:358 gc:universal NODE_1077_length_2323_cov_0.329137:310-1383(+)
MFFVIVFSIQHCIVGAGPGGVTMSRQIRREFTEKSNDEYTHKILLIDDKFDGGNLNKVKEWKSNLCFQTYVEYGQEMGLDEFEDKLPVYRSFKTASGREKPTIKQLIELINELREYMIESQQITIARAFVTSIHVVLSQETFERESSKKEIYILYSEDSKIAECDYVYLALGGSPKSHTQLDVYEQLGMYDSLEYLKYLSDDEKILIKKKHIFIVGVGDTAHWLKSVLMNNCISFTTVNSKNEYYSMTFNTGGGVQFSDWQGGEFENFIQSRHNLLKDNIIVFYAHGLESNEAPPVIYNNNKVELLENKSARKIKSYRGSIEGQNIDLYTIGLMSEKGGFISYANHANDLIKLLKIK